MDKKFDIVFFEKCTSQFLEYLRRNIDVEVNSFLDEISKDCEVLIFSGIIRNFFIRYRGGLRDLDLVVNPPNSTLVESYFSKYQYKKNSFGGFKVFINNLTIDIWELQNTWALNHNKVGMELFDNYNLPNTVFFNFSAVAFNYNEKRFITSESFIKFLQNKELDLVLSENPLPQLCIVNTIHYMVKFELEVSENLKRYFIKNFYSYSIEEYEGIQLKHFNQVLYPFNYLRVWFNFFSQDINESEKNLSNKYHV